MIVRFVNRQTKFPVAEWRALLARVLPQALAMTAFGRQLERMAIAAEVTVTFAGPRLMRQINRETRQVDCLTDVLSFPLLDMTEGRLNGHLAAQDFDPEQIRAGQKAVPIGDIVLSLDKALAQAEEYGHPAGREVAFLSVHGLLHLLGYDHMTPKDEKNMRLMQKKILDRLGLGRGEENE